MKRLQFAFALACMLALARPGFSLTVAPATPDERVQNAAAICHATVLSAESFRSEADGGLYTRTWLRVNEAFKGQFPATFTNWFRAGNPVVPTTTNGSFTNFPAATNRLFFRVLRVP